MKQEKILSDSFKLESQGFHYRECGCDSCRSKMGDHQLLKRPQFEASSRSILTTDSLKSLAFKSHTDNAVSANGETLKYYIHSVTGHIDFEDNTYGTSLGHTNQEESFIESVFDRIDKYIDLDFHKLADWNGSTFDIYCMSYYSNWEDSTLGRANRQGSGSGSYWDLYWKNTSIDGRLNNNDSMTIVHEIGHGLGLSHPNEDPKNVNWSTDDTVMSYNIGHDGWGKWFTDLDVAALIEIWGVEDDNGRGHSGTSLNDYFSGSDSDDVFAGFAGNDELIAYRGADSVFGYEGDDLIRAGNGRDHVWGGGGADDLYGGFGHNTFGDERDGSKDWLYFKSDQFAWNWLYGSSGNNPAGQKVDIFKGLDRDDRLFLQGVQTFALSFRQVTNFSSPTGTYSGIGIFAYGFLEAIYTGGDLTPLQLQSMTVGVDA